MGRPPHCSCHCEQPFPDCFGCLVSQVGPLPQNISLTSSGWSWLFPETDTGTETVITSDGGAGKLQSVTTHYTRSRPLSSLNGTRQMRIKPDQSCQWIWNNVRASHTVYRRGIGFGPTIAALDEVSIFEPLNPTDASSPWGRDVGTVSDSRCTTTGSGYLCQARLDNTLLAKLLPARLTVTDTTNRYFVYDSAGTWHWLLEISFMIGRSAINNSWSSYSGTAAINGSSTGVNKVVPVGWRVQPGAGGSVPPVGQAFDVAFVTSNTSGGVSSTPPYRYQSTFFPLGGPVLYYAAPIDCVNDFAGTPRMLTRAQYTAAFGARPALWDITFPSTVTIQVL